MSHNGMASVKLKSEVKVTNNKQFFLLVINYNDCI